MKVLKDAVEYMFIYIVILFITMLYYISENIVLDWVIFLFGAFILIIDPLKYYFNLEIDNNPKTPIKKIIKAIIAIFFLIGSIIVCSYGFIEFVFVILLLDFFAYQIIGVSIYNLFEEKIDAFKK